MLLTVWKPWTMQSAIQTFILMLRALSCVVAAMEVFWLAIWLASTLTGSRLLCFATLCWTYHSCPGCAEFRVAVPMSFGVLSQGGAVLSLQV